MSGDNRRRFHALVDDILDRDDFTYNTSAEAAKDLAVAAFNLAASELGLTGFQASWAMLSAYVESMHIDGPVMVIQARDSLYPQYRTVDRVRQWLDGADVGAYLATEAAALLAQKSDRAAEQVVAHWRHLAGATVPTPSDGEGTDK